MPSALAQWLRMVRVKSEPRRMSPVTGRRSSNFVRAAKARSSQARRRLLGYESFTAFAFEASFFGILTFGRNRTPRWSYLLACLMVAFAATMSSFWIMVNNSWMQSPVGFTTRPDDAHAGRCARQDG